MKNLVGFFIFVSSFQAIALEVTEKNLKSLLEEKNIKVNSAKLEHEAAKERQGYLARSFLPSLDLYAAQESFKQGVQENKNQPTYGAEAKINIFNGGRDLLESEIRTVSADQKSFQAQRIQSEELEKARSLFWQIIFSKEKIELINSALKINEQSSQSAAKRIRSGVATESDRFEFEMKMTELKQELAETQLTYESQRRDLALILGLEKADELKLTGKMDHEHDFESRLAHQAKDHEFLYKENELHADLSELSAKQQNRGWLPKIDAYAQYNQYNERDKEFAQASDRKESVVGLRMTMSLGSALESSREAAALYKQALGSKNLAEQNRREVEAHIINELEQLRLMHGLVHSAEDNILRAEKYFKLSLSEYGRGVKNSPDVLGASEKLYEIRKKRIELIRDFQMAKAHVLSKLGR